jgi:hypothetical protein
MGEILTGAILQWGDLTCIPIYLYWHFSLIKSGNYYTAEILLNATINICALGRVRRV